jgi:hypothetical protein
MPERSDRREKNRRFPDEETWLREFVGFHGTDGVTRFCEEDLDGVSLVQIAEAIQRGSVVEAEKCDGPGALCKVEHYTEENALITVSVHFASGEETLTILKAGIEEFGREPDDAA